MVDYSKWDNIDISDDEGEDCHPNIDKRSWIKWKKEAKQLKKEEEKAQKENEEKEYLSDKQQLALLLSSSDSAQQKKVVELQSKIKAYEVKKAKEEEMRKKYPVWDEESICHEGFSKTIINKIEPTHGIPQITHQAPKHTHPTEPTQEAKEAKEDAPKPVAKPAAEEPSSEPLKTEEKVEEIQETTEEDEEQKRQVDEYVRQMEIKAHRFAMCKTFEEYFEVIKLHPEIVCEETHQYLLLHSSDFLKKGQDDLSKHYLKGACIVNYSLELGKDGISLFFARMRDSNPKWRLDFEMETQAYWQRIREKYIELGKIPAKPETKEAPKTSKPSKIEDDLD